MGGLQVFSDVNMTDASHAVPSGSSHAQGRYGRWVDIPAVEDAIVINCGDYLSLLTGGVFKSPLHRVTTGEQQRSVALACLCRFGLMPPSPRVWWCV